MGKKTPEPFDAFNYFFNRPKLTFLPLEKITNLTFKPNEREEIQVAVDRLCEELIFPPQGGPLPVTKKLSRILLCSKQLVEDNSRLWTSFRSLHPALQLQVVTRMLSAMQRSGSQNVFRFDQLGSSQGGWQALVDIRGYLKIPGAPRIHLEAFSRFLTWCKLSVEHSRLLVTIFNQLLAISRDSWPSKRGRPRSSRDALKQAIALVYAQYWAAGGRKKYTYTTTLLKGRYVGTFVRFIYEILRQMNLFLLGVGRKNFPVALSIKGRVQQMNALGRIIRELMSSKQRSY